MRRAVAAIALALMLGAPLAAEDPPLPPPAKTDADHAKTLLADQFEYALLVGDGGRLPLAENFRYTENGQALAITDGMWRTLSALAGYNPRTFPAAKDLDFRISFADRNEVLRVVETDENGTKGVTAFRIKLSAGKIAEAEIIPIREEFPGNRGGTVSLFQPALPLTMDGELVKAPEPLLLAKAAKREARDALVPVAETYIRALAGEGGPAVFSADCIRRDNGVRTTGVKDAPSLDPAQPGFRPFALSCADQLASGYFSNIRRARGLRSWADPDRGLVISFVQLDIPGTVMGFDAPGVGRVAYPGAATVAPLSGQQFDGRAAANMILPVTMNCVFVFKVEDGKIRRVESFYRAAQYGLRSGW